MLNLREKLLSGKEFEPGSSALSADAFKSQSR